MVVAYLIRVFVGAFWPLQATPLQVGNKDLVHIPRSQLIIILRIIIWYFLVA